MRPFLVILGVLHLNLALNPDHIVSDQKSRPSTTALAKSLLDEPKCGEIKNACNNLSENDDILVLECMQSWSPSKLANLNEECHQKAWEHVERLLQNDRVRDILIPYCQNDLSMSSCKLNPDTPSGDYLKCIVNYREEIHNKDCLDVLGRLEGVAFQDYRWIQGFLEHCKEDVTKLSCGRIDSINLDQSSTIACLQTNILNINDECKREVFKLSELQADNIKHDRQLYLACVDDHRRYCSQFPAGSGRVFNCLMDQPPDRLTKQCHAQLLRRQKLVLQDFRVSKGLWRSCKDDIKKTHCRKQTSGDKSVRLAQVLLCLEGVMKNGTKVNPSCEAEMVEHRKMLMENYRLSPEIVDGCREEIRRSCDGLEVGGKTIHCLMEHARLNVKNRIGDTCLRAIENLVKETDAGEDWRVDPVLHQACFSAVEAICRDVRGGDARVMSCLMDNINADGMTDECEDALMQIQYFIARDFKLEPQLYKACREDAERICHASKNWEEGAQDTPSYSPQVLPCLYRYAYHQAEDQNYSLNRACLRQIERVKRQRAISVDLQPEVEQICLADLSMFCYDKTKRGEEMMCLQKNFDDLHEVCKAAVSAFTEAESQHAQVNPYINQNCKNEMHALCNVEMKHDEGDVMECLINHKNDPLVKANPPCRVSIEHFQIISLKDYKFTYKFKMACKNFAVRFCAAARTKSEVVTCLSEKVTNDTIRGFKSDIPKECRQQLKAQLFQQRENIDLNPRLKNACSLDIPKFCANIEHGNSQVIECLQNVGDRLSDKCETEVFKLKKQEFGDNSVDYNLITLCGDAIDQFCPHQPKETVLECLKKHKEEHDFNKKCRQVVLHRLAEQNSNYQLNPGLQENCKTDIKKYCDHLKVKHDKDYNGAVIKCLKNHFKTVSLSPMCGAEIVEILKEQALDVALNPLLKVICKNELETLCKVHEVDAGEAEECLKNMLIEKKIATPECRVEVANMIEESQVDIQVDPLLQQVCALDVLKFCKDIPEGNGRHIKCLKIIMKDRRGDQLSPDCKDMLSKRMKMYENAALVAPVKNFNELYQQVVTSPAKHYFFMMILMIIGSIFVMGIFFGRSFKRHVSLKNK